MVSSNPANTIIRLNISWFETSFFFFRYKILWMKKNIISSRTGENCWGKHLVDYLNWFGWVLWHMLGYLMPNPLYIKYMIWFRFVLWHINHYRLFNANSSLYIYIKYIGVDLFGFYGISTIVGYLMPNPLYIKYIWFG